MIAALLILAQSVSPHDVEGIWHTKGNQSQIEVTTDGESVKGAIVWYIGHDENPVFDVENPDEALKQRELLGVEILSGFKKGRKKWQKGEIYDPTVGRTYRAAITRVDAETLTIQGCYGPVCQSEDWKLVPEGEITRVERAPLTLEASEE